MAMSNELELGTLRLYFGNVVDAASILDDLSDGILATVTDGFLYLSLHTGPVGEAGNQTTNEAEYVDYARDELPRTLAAGDDWTVAANVLSNTDDILFPTAGVGTVEETITHWAIGTASSGAGHVLFHGAFVTAPVIFSASNEGVPAADLFHAADHGFISGDTILFFTSPGGTLPPPIAEGTIYWVIFGSLKTFNVASDAILTPLGISDDGSGWVAKVTPLTVNAGVQPKITAGTLQVQLH